MFTVTLVIDGVITVIPGRSLCRGSVLRVRELARELAAGRPPHRRQLAAREARELAAGPPQGRREAARELPARPPQGRRAAARELAAGPPQGRRRAAARQVDLPAKSAPGAP